MRALPLLALCLLIVACAGEQTVVVGPSAPAAPEPATPPAAAPETTAPEEPAAYDPAVETLLTAHEGKVKSIGFRYAPIEMAETGPVTRPQHVYSWRGDRARADIDVPKSYDKDTFVDTVYLDLTLRTARGFCNDRKPSVCSIEGEEREADFADYDITYPLELLDEVPPSAIIAETRYYEQRDVRVLHWEEGMHYELYIDPFMGVPVRYAYYADDGYTDLRGGIEYHDIEYNLVKETDVLP